MSLLTRLFLKRMDAFAETAPGLYYALVWMLAFFGGAYLLLFPALVIAMPGFLVYAITQNSPLQWQPLQWLLAAGLIAGTSIAARITMAILKVKVDLPAGKPLDAKSFPILIDRITELCNTYSAPTIHHVKLTTHFRIELIRTPSSGFPSKYINTLLIGLPVVSCISPLHLKLLLARHIGPLAKNRNNRCIRILYLRNIWNMYAQYYKQSWQAETLLLRLFFFWYAPLFNVCTIAAAKHGFFVKDKCLLEITSAENAAEAIAVFSIKKRYLKLKFWPQLNESAYKTPKPTYLPYKSMESVMNQALDIDTAQHFYELEVNREPGPGSEVPNLLKRLAAIGYEDFVIPLPKKESAAHHFLGDQLVAIQKQLDNVWYLKNKTIWAHRYTQGIEEKRYLKTLREHAAQSLLSNAEAREYLLLIEKYVTPEKALPLYQEIIKTNMMDPDVCYELGRLLLDAGDDAGIDALKIAMDTSKERTPDCCHHIVEYMVKTGNVKEAQSYRRMIIEHQVAN